jgi:hypothetical protein
VRTWASPFFVRRQASTCERGKELAVAWGWHDKAYALIVLQAGLFTLNLRGAKKNEA